MNITGSMPSRRPARRAWLWIAAALMLEMPHAGRPQGKQNSAVQNPVQRILSELKALMSDSKFMYEGLDLGSGIVVAVYNSQLAYIPASYPVKSGTNTSVVWSSMYGPFTITPIGLSPFDTAPIYSVQKDIPGGGTVYVVKATVPASTPKGTYHYALALDYAGKVYADVNCPPIIVE